MKDSYKQDIDAYLDKILPQGLNKTLSAMRYSVLNGGKRFRPGLVYAVGNILKVSADNLHAAAASVELIHCYSLIFDDLPAMDDDDLRRGVATCHKKYDEATAILAGSALHNFAFEVLAGSENKVEKNHKLKMIEVLSVASGMFGMLQGQTYDIAAENTKISLQDMQDIHRQKTGRLITASINLGILAAECQDVFLTKQLLEYGDLLGILFQIKDDILDRTSNTDEIGKPAKSDEKNNKSTYVSILGIVAAQNELDEKYKNIIVILDKLKDQYSDFDFAELYDIAKICVTRNN